MKIFVTSDLHFNHKNILKYEPNSRPFDTIDEMNQVLINNWNKVVQPCDTVYVCGDLFMGEIEDIPNILNQLNGRIILVRGNHDTRERINLYQNFGIEIKDIAYFRYKGKYFILCHYPITNPEFFDMVFKDNKEIVTLYGHIHSKAPIGYYKGTFHVGVDTNELTPISLEDIWLQCCEADPEMRED